jgi:hypothetical protein
MAEKLAAKGSPAAPVAPLTTPATELLALDQSDDQTVLRWKAVNGATGYRVYRSTGDQPAQAIGDVVTQLFWVDAGLQPKTSYSYTVRAVTGDKEGPDSNAVTLGTAAKPPQCDPYFSMAQGKIVTKSLMNPMGVPTTAVCP